MLLVTLNGIWCYDVGNYWMLVWNNSLYIILPDPFSRKAGSKEWGCWNIIICSSLVHTCMSVVLSPDPTSSRGKRSGDNWTSSGWSGSAVLFCTSQSECRYLFLYPSNINYTCVAPCTYSMGYVILFDDIMARPHTLSILRSHVTVQIPMAMKSVKGRR